MITAEGADSSEIIIRPEPDGTWRIEFPSREDAVAIAATELDAVILAKQLQPNTAIRILPAREVDTE